MTVSFNQRGQYIQARLTDSTKASIRLSTGIKVPDHLKFDKGRFCGNTHEVLALNNELNRQRVKLTDLYMVYRGNPDKIKSHFNPDVMDEVSDPESYDLVDLIRRYVQMADRGEIRSKRNRKLSSNTIIAYANALRVLAAFAKEAGSLDLMTVVINPRDEVAKKMEVAERWNRYWREFDDWMVEEQYTITSRGVFTTNLSIMINYWKEKFFLQLPKLRGANVDPNPILVLDPKFVRHFLTDEKTYKSLSGSRRYTWEVCATILITTMRIDDAIKMSVSDLHITKDAMFLSKMNGKTREYTDIPIPKFLERIYRDNLMRHGNIYCMNGTYKMILTHIAEVFAMYPEMHEIATMKTFGVHGEEVTKVGPMYSHVHPHMLRKTAITTMIYYKVSERHIKFCSGHKENSIAFERYVAFTERHFKSEVSQYYKEFLGE